MNNIIITCKDCKTKYETEIAGDVYDATLEYKKSDVDMDNLFIYVKCQKCGAEFNYTAQHIYDGIIQYKEHKSHNDFIKEY